jgi:hypothetical protein
MSDPRSCPFGALSPILKDRRGDGASCPIPIGRNDDSLPMRRQFAESSAQQPRNARADSFIALEVNRR